MQISSLGPIEGGVDRFSGALRSALSRLPSPPRLIILYLPLAADHGAYLHAIARLTPVPVLGATTGGMAFTERGVTTGGAVAAIVHGDTPALVSHTTNLRDDILGKSKSCVAGLVEQWKQSGAKGRYSVLVLADAHNCDGELLAEALRAVTPSHCQHHGATAGDNFTFTETKVFHGTKVLTNAAVFALLPAPPGFEVRALHGFSAVDGSREMLITRVAGNVLEELDGRPAATVYEEELRRLGLYRDGDDLRTVMGVYELGARTLLDPQALKIRAPLALVETKVVLASGLPEGTVVRVVHATADALIDAARRLSEGVIGTRAKDALHGALVFDCSARYMLLGARYAEQVAAFGSKQGLAYCGFASYGELAKSSGSLQGFHNTTAVMAAF